MARTVNLAAKAAGLDADRYAGHSLRAGLATSAAKAGKSERAIMAQTGHRSVVIVRRYIRDGSLFADNARELGAWLKDELERLANTYPPILKGVRGLGLMVGFELAPKEQIPPFASGDKAPSMQFVNLLHQAGLLTIPSGTQVIRLLPALNLQRSEAEEGIAIIERVVKSLV